MINDIDSVHKQWIEAQGHQNSSHQALASLYLINGVIYKKQGHVESRR